MRKYIRHPSSIPLHFQVEENLQTIKNEIKDISVGGLCFSTDQPMSPGTKIHIRIPLTFFADKSPSRNLFDAEAFDADGYVTWCQREAGKYAVGIQFDDQSTQFGVRMVEQVCHIEQYRSGVLKGEGRALDEEEAAREWVEKYAADFPS